MQDRVHLLFVDINIEYSRTGKIESMLKFHRQDLVYIVGVAFLMTTISRKMRRLNPDESNYCNCAPHPLSKNKTEKEIINHKWLLWIVCVQYRALFTRQTPNYWAVLSDKKMLDTTADKLYYSENAWQVLGIKIGGIMKIRKMKRMICKQDIKRAM